MGRWLQVAAWLAVGVSLATACGDDDPATSEPSAGAGPGASPVTEASGAAPDGTGDIAVSDPATSDAATSDPAVTAPAGGATSADATTPAETATTPAEGGETGDAGGSGGLVGTWELTHLTFDDDADYVLDEAERASDLGMRYGFTSIEFRADGTCVLAEDEQRYDGTCRVGACSEMATRPEDCDLLAATGSRMLALEPAPDAMATFGGTYGLLGWSDDELVFKDMSGAEGTIYIYTRGA